MSRETFHAGNTGPIRLPVSHSSGQAADASGSVGGKSIEVNEHRNRRELDVSGARPGSPANLVFPYLAAPLVDQILEHLKLIEQDQHDTDGLHLIRINLRKLEALWWAYEPLLGVTRARDDRESIRLLARAIGGANKWNTGCADVIPLFSEGRQSLNCFVTIESIRIRIARQIAHACDDIQLKQTLRHIVARATDHLRSSDSAPFSAFASERLEKAEENLARVAAAAASSGRIREDHIRRVRRAADRICDLVDCFEVVSNH